MEDASTETGSCKLVGLQGRKSFDRGSQATKQTGNKANPLKYKEVIQQKFKRNWRENEPIGASRT